MELLEQGELEELGAGGVDAISKIARVLFGGPGHRTVEKTASTAITARIHSAVDLSAITKLACARELLRLNVITPAQALSLGKYANVTVEHARRSLDRLDSLERNKPTLGQAARYGALGGAGGAAIGAIGNAIEHGSALKGATPKAKALNLAANAVKGSLGGGAIPLARASLDRRAEMGTLRRFMNEPTQKQAAEKDVEKLLDTAASSSGKGARLALAGSLGVLGTRALATNLSDRASVNDKASGLFEAVKRLAGGVPIQLGERGPSFGTDSRRVYLPESGSSAATLAHELGHADIDKHRVGRPLQNAASAVKNFGGVGSAIAGFGAGLAGSEDMKRLALLGAVLSAVPDVGVEAGASVNAIRRLRAAGASPKQQLAAAAELLPALMPYVGGAALPIAGTYAGHGLGSFIRAERQTAEKAVA